MTLVELNDSLSKFLAQPQVHKYANVEAFYAAHPAMHPFEVGFSENA